MANNVDSDEVAHYEPPHLNLQCLQTETFFSFLMIEGLKGVNYTYLMADPAHLSS